jgi:hypothetical protein
LGGSPAFAVYFCLLDDHEFDSAVLAIGLFTFPWHTRLFAPVGCGEEPLRREAHLDQD